VEDKVVAVVGVPVWGMDVVATFAGWQHIALLAAVGMRILFVAGEFADPVMVSLRSTVASDRSEVGDWDRECRSEELQAVPISG
jgi:hypothetical protein